MSRLLGCEPVAKGLLGAARPWSRSHVMVRARHTQRSAVPAAPCRACREQSAGGSGESSGRRQVVASLERCDDKRCVPVG
jgi:hypothetical protein